MLYALMFEDKKEGAVRKTSTLIGKRLTRRECLAYLAGAVATSIVCGASRAESEPELMRFAMSVATLGPTNINDARVAYRLWTTDLLQRVTAIRVEVDSEMFIPSDEILRKIRQGQLDCFGITAIEYMKVMQLTDNSEVIVQDYMADGIEYVLLVHNSSRFKKLADLRGAQVLMLNSRDMLLSQAWLSTMLAANGLPATDDFFASLQENTSATQTILPLFFRHTDAACVTKRSWDIAVELNPQLGRELHPITISPKVVPALICFRRHCNPTAKRMMENTLLNMTSRPSGQQIAALFQAQKVAVCPGTLLQITVDMLTKYERLGVHPAGVRKAKAD